MNNKDKLNQLPRLTSTQLTEVWGGINRGVLMTELQRIEQLLRTTQKLPSPSRPIVKR
jgi:hypothetical protein